MCTAAVADILLYDRLLLLLKCKSGVAVTQTLVGENLKNPFILTHRDRTSLGNGGAMRVSPADFASRNCCIVFYRQ